MEFREILDRIDKMIDECDSVAAPRLEGLVSDDNKIPEILRNRGFIVDFADNKVHLRASNDKEYFAKCHPDDKFNAVIGINDVIAKWLIDVNKEAIEARKKKEVEAKAKKFKVGDKVTGRTKDTMTAYTVGGEVIYITNNDVAVITPGGSIRVLYRDSCKKVSV